MTDEFEHIAEPLRRVLLECRRQMLARQAERIDEACSNLIDLMAAAPHEPAPLRAYVGLSAMGEDATRQFRKRSARR